MKTNCLKRSGEQNSKGEDLYFMKIVSKVREGQRNLSYYSAVLKDRLRSNHTRSELLEYVKKENHEWLEESILMTLSKLIEAIDYKIEDHTGHVDVTAQLYVLLTKEQIDLLTNENQESASSDK